MVVYISLTIRHFPHFLTIPMHTPGGRLASRPKRPHLGFPVQCPRWVCLLRLNKQTGGSSYVGVDAHREQSCQNNHCAFSLIAMSSVSAAPKLATSPPSGICSLQEVDARQYPPQPSQPRSSEEGGELEPRPTTPQGRQKPASGLSNIAKANIRVAVRNILNKDHSDKEEYFCLITGFSNHERPSNYAHVVPGATPSSVVSLLVDTWLMLLIGL